MFLAKYPCHTYYKTNLEKRVSFEFSHPFITTQYTGGYPTSHDGV